MHVYMYINNRVLDLQSNLIDVLPKAVFAGFSGVNLCVNMCVSVCVYVGCVVHMCLRSILHCPTLFTFVPCSLFWFFFIDTYIYIYIYIYIYTCLYIFPFFLLFFSFFVFLFLLFSPEMLTFFWYHF